MEKKQQNYTRMLGTVLFYHGKACCYRKVCKQKTFIRSSRGSDWPINDSNFSGEEKTTVLMKKSKEQKLLRKDRMRPVAKGLRFFLRFNKSNVIQSGNLQCRGFPRDII